MNLRSTIRAAQIVGISLLSAGMSTSTGLLASSPACAQNATYTDCVQNLINLGVSPDVAATECRQLGGGSDQTACIDRLMYTTARATSGPTDQGEWRFYQTIGSLEAMTAVGCRQAGFLGVDGWRCPQQEMRFQVMTAAEANARCNGLPIPVTVVPSGAHSSHASTSGQNRSLQVTNYTVREIYRLYASPSGQNAWSGDLLGQYTIPTGSSWNLLLNGGTCNYDFRAEMEDGSYVVKRNVNVCFQNNLGFYP